MSDRVSVVPLGALGRRVKSGASSKAPKERPRAPQGFEHKTVAAHRLALVGQPNVGKSVIFQLLTGRYVTVSNYPGTTVEISRGVGKIGGEAWEVIDTPGLRSLFPRSEDEVAARDALLDEPPDVIVQVADAKALRRTLHLTLEIAQLGRPMVLVLNLTDEARARGFGLDSKRLSKALGFPVVETVAVTGEGIADLKKAILEARSYGGPGVEPPDIAVHLPELSEALPQACPSRRAVSEMLLGGDPTMERYLAHRWGWSGKDRVDAKRRGFATSPSLLGFAWRESVAEELSAASSWQKGGQTPGWLDKLGMHLLRPLAGSLAAVVVLFLLYEFVGVWAAQVAVDFMEDTVFGKWLLPPTAAAFHALPLPRWLIDFFVGPMGLISMGLTYALAIVLPVVTAFFLFFGGMEDSGYLPRLSVLLDRLFRKVGLNGKAVFPMILGLGCGTMATLTTRVLDSARERMLVTLLLALAIPCSAQLGVVMGLLAGLSVWAVVAWVGAVAVVFFIVGWAAARLLPGARAPFWIEIPPLRAPRPINLIRKVKTRVVWYLREAVPLFLIGTALLFMLDRTGGLKGLETVMAPVVTGWLGLPREASFALISGFLRRDYGAAGFYALSRRGLLDAQQVVVSLVTLTLFVPCFAQFLMMVKERGVRTAAWVLLAVTGIALLAGGLMRGILSSLGGLR